MGIVNAAPDSFSGGFADVDAAAAHAIGLIADGADILDIGGESTRPGATPISGSEETARVVPVIAAIRDRAPGHPPISIDTMKPSVARIAVAAGATMWNDVTALAGSPDSLAVAAELACGVVLMHMRGDPRTMQIDPRYDDVVGEVAAYLASRAEAAVAAGVREADIWLDPGIGFGKTPVHNICLLSNLDRIVALGFPVLVGVSRKGFLAKIGAGGEAPADRIGGSLAAAMIAARAGVAAVRVHEVRETVHAFSLMAAVDA